MIELTGIQIIDVFFRFTAVGILISSIFVTCFCQQKEHHLSASPVIACLVCVISYVLLTAPIEDHHYGGLRHLLLLFTDLTPFVILWLSLNILNASFQLKKMPKPLLMVGGLYLLWLVYFFLVKGGKGVMHDVNHVIGMLTFTIAIFLSLNGYFDDLDNQRRNRRLLLIASCVGYMCLLTVFEFVLKGVRDSWQFSLFNSAMMFSMIGYYFIRLITQENEPKPHDNKAKAQASWQREKLNLYMDEQGFLQSNLTIGELANQLTIPEHQLRQVINKELGYSNFSSYLNSYRIPYICEQLKDPNKSHIPVLTLALEAGYGSIAPFNRAFKQQKGMTPSEYRSQI